MVAALVAGGMTAAYSDERNQLAQAHADEHYHPNKSGLYEVPLKEYGGIDFPLAYQDRCIKVMLWGLDGLAVNPDGYRIVIMRRDPEEIRQSYEAFLGHPLRHPWMSEYDARIERAELMLRNRDDVHRAVTVNYSDLVGYPENEFNWLKRDGWPIHAGKAAATIDPKQYRFRKELLTAGI